MHVHIYILNKMSMATSFVTTSPEEKSIHKTWIKTYVLGETHIPVPITTSKPTRPWGDARDKLVDLVGDNTKFDDLPVIGVRSGMTDYIDTIAEESIPGPVCVFVDQFSRAGIALKVHITDEAENIVEHAVYAMFQRYTDSGLWVLCVSHECRDGGVHGDKVSLARVLGANTAMSPESFAILTRLLGGDSDVDVDGVKHHVTFK